MASKAGRRTGSEVPWLHRAALKYASLDCSQNQGVSDIRSGAKGQTTLLSAVGGGCLSSEQSALWLGSFFLGLSFPSGSRDG